MIVSKSFPLPQPKIVCEAQTLDLVLYHAHESVHGTNDTRLAPIRKLLEIAPVIILSAADNPESLREAFESGARGYIPTTSTPAELVVRIIHLVRAGGTFVPPSGLHLQSTTRKSLTPRTAMNQQFTPCQIAVLGQLMQGKANKIIAYQLAMSESTVKVHIRNIMKKMNASNRTEMAYRAQALATFEGHVTGMESGEPLHEVRRSPMSEVAAGH